MLRPSMSETNTMTRQNCHLFIEIMYNTSARDTEEACPSGRARDQLLLHRCQQRPGETQARRPRADQSCHSTDHTRASSENLSTAKTIGHRRKLSLVTFSPHLLVTLTRHSSNLWRSSFRSWRRRTIVTKTRRLSARAGAAA